MKILNFPEFRQTYNYDCGANAIQTVLAYYGFDVSENKIMEMAGTTKKGTSASGIKKVIKKYRLKYESGTMNLSKLRDYIDKKIPVIIPLQAWTEDKNAKYKNDWIDGHYAVAIGYDQKRIYFEDPSSVLRTYLTLEELKRRWHDKGADGKKYFNYGIAVYGKKPNWNQKRIIHMK